MTRYADLATLQRNINPDVRIVVVILLVVLMIAFAIAIMTLGAGVKRGKK